MAEASTAISMILGVAFGIPLVILLIWSFLNITIVRQKESMIVERWGKFHEKWESGFHWLCPMMDRVRPIVWRETEVFNNNIEMRQTYNTRVDMRQKIMDFPIQPIITRDNVEIGVHPMLVYELIDPVRVAYETYDLNHAVEKLVQTTLRSIIGDMGLDDTLASREEINRGILKKISHICYNWGINVCRVELLEIVPTPSVQDAMHRQLAAERMRRAAIVTAEGYREKIKTEAEGNCQATIALATGEQQCTIINAKAAAEARILIARAEADALRIVGDALKEVQVDTTQYMVAIRYIETLSALASRANQRVIYLPFETDIVGASAYLSTK